jgi:small subunit ribosomal protein S9
MTKNSIFFATSKRKRAIAKVELTHCLTDKPILIINKQNAFSYLQENVHLFSIIEKPFLVINANNESYIHKYNVNIKAFGGGLKSQAEAIQKALARALLKVDSLNRPSLKKGGFLTQDSRRKERKKYGLKKSRKASQFSKR